jgi:hypothetical protein
MTRLALKPVEFMALNRRQQAPPNAHRAVIVLLRPLCQRAPSGLARCRCRAVAGHRTPYTSAPLAPWCQRRVPSCPWATFLSDGVERAQVHVAPSPHRPSARLKLPVSNIQSSRRPLPIHQQIEAANSPSIPSLNWTASHAGIRLIRMANDMIQCLVLERGDLSADMAHNGFARSINPVHTMSDGDTIFALSTGKASSVCADVSAIGAIAATVMAQAVARAVVQAESLTEHQLPAHGDYVKG